jgi:AcrR family transcriptional regulator
MKKCPEYSLASYRSAVALRHSPHGRPAYDPYQRRVELYVKAAPVFRTFGYRQVTMKALAHACGISAPALYRYFPSKLDFALFPLAEPPTGYCAALTTAAADAHTDPLRGLRAALEAAVAHADLMALGVQLAIEAGRDEPHVFSSSRIDSLDASVRDVLLHCVPALGSRAQDFAHTLVSLVVTAGAARASLTPEDLWRQGGPVVRAYLLDAGIDDARFCEVFAG